MKMEEFTDSAFLNFLQAEIDPLTAGSGGAGPGLVILAYSHRLLQFLCLLKSEDISGFSLIVPNSWKRRLQRERVCLVLRFPRRLSREEGKACRELACLRAEGRLEVTAKLSFTPQGLPIISQ